MDKEIIRRVIRRHIAELKSCYERTLAKKATVGGKIDVQFTINQNGEVPKSLVLSSTVADPPMEACVVKATTTWQFPKPRGNGIVVVTYPFIFKSVVAMDASSAPTPTPTPAPPPPSTTPTAAEVASPAS